MGSGLKIFFSSRASKLILKRLSPYQTGLSRFDLDLQNSLVYYKHFGDARPQFHSQSWINTLWKTRKNTCLQCKQFPRNLVQYLSFTAIKLFLLKEAPINYFIKFAFIRQLPWPGNVYILVLLFLSCSMHFSRMLKTMTKVYR